MRSGVHRAALAVAILLVESGIAARPAVVRVSAGGAGRIGVSAASNCGQKHFPRDLSVQTTTPCPAGGVGGVGGNRQLANIAIHA